MTSSTSPSARVFFLSTSLYRMAETNIRNVDVRTGSLLFIASRSSLENCSKVGIEGALSLHHPAAHLATCFLRFLFAAHARRLVILPPLNFLHDPVAFAFLFKSAKRFFNGFVFSHFNQRQCHTILSCVLSLAAILIFVLPKCGNAY